MCIAPSLSVLNSYTVVMDAAPGPDTSDNNLNLILVQDPVATQIRETSLNVGVNDSSITIDVSKALSACCTHNLSSSLILGTAYH